jgi:hypothetical protein
VAHGARWCANGVASTTRPERAPTAACDLDWEEGRMIGRKEPRQGMERVARDGGVARHATARWRGRHGEAARHRMGNFLSFLETNGEFVFFKKRSLVVMEGSRLIASLDHIAAPCMGTGHPDGRPHQSTSVSQAKLN